MPRAQARETPGKPSGPADGRATGPGDEADETELVTDDEPDRDPRYADGWPPEALERRRAAAERFARAVQDCKLQWTHPDLDPCRFRLDFERYARLTKQGFHAADLVRPGRAVRTRAVTKELRDLALRPARLEDLLAYAAWTGENAFLQPVAALGSRREYADGTVCVPYLSRLDGKRRLSLHVDDPKADWPAEFAFLGVRPGP